MKKAATVFVLILAMAGVIVLVHRQRVDRANKAFNWEYFK